jgi:hypothetical protein
MKEGLETAVSNSFTPTIDNLAVMVSTITIQ